uniref:Muscleblind n=1 Tax=Rhipicephalus appendiculatus TaxID=34631 RepID=A0A131YRD1_RHIAP
MPALTTMATASSFGHYLTPSPVLPGMMTADAVTAPLSVVPASLVSPQKVARTDRLEATEGGSTDVGLQMYTQPGLGDPSASKKRPRESADEVVLCCCPESPLPLLLAQGLFDTQQTVYEVFRPNIVALPGLVPYTKRPALDKSGVPVYQPSATAYQQALALQMQQPFVPVSFTGHPAGVPRF